MPTEQVPGCARIESVFAQRFLAPQQREMRMGNGQVLVSGHATDGAVATAHLDLRRQGDAESHGPAVTTALAANPVLGAQLSHGEVAGRRASS